MDHPVALRGRDQAFDAIEAIRQGEGIRAALLHPSVELLELHEPDCRSDLRHAVVEADKDVLVLRNLAVVPKEAGLFRDLVVIGEDHAAFAGRHVLRRVE